MFTKEKSGRYVIKDIRKMISILDEEMNKEKTIKVDYTPDSFFKYKKGNSVITLGCTDIMGNQIIDPDVATEEIISKAILHRITNLSSFKEADHIWIHSVDLIPFKVEDETKHRLEVFGFIKLENDYFEKHMLDEKHLEEEYSNEKDKMVKKLEEVLNAKRNG
ncbi:hypothetical protein M0R36_09605 [bacterium]|jgi:hypothetical protein|nr:hypothetical protein [bacterium]